MTFNFFINKIVSRLAKQHMEHIQLLTPEYMQWFNEVDESFANEPQNMALRQYQNKMWLYDYAEGNVMLHGKRNHFPTGEVWRRKRQMYKYNVRHHIHGLYEYKNGFSGAGLVNYDADTARAERENKEIDLNKVQFPNEADQFYHQHARFSDYEATNKVMRRFSTEEIVDVGVVSGVVIALWIVISQHLSSTARAGGKRKVD